MLSVFFLTCFAALPQEDFPEKAPAADADAHVAFKDTSSGGLRYLWWLPKDYDGSTPRNLTVILHGTGLDYRWGGWNNKPGVFRPLDIVISVDGTSPGSGTTRLFLGEKEDAEQFRDFLAEMREKFAVHDIFLYGHSQGGFFVVYYAGEFPHTVKGVVAHASGAWNWTNMSAGLHKVAVAFMHGTLDPVVPYRQSPGSRGIFVDAGYRLIHLRRLVNQNHWPNAVRANEALGWCEGMTTDDPERALVLARNLLRSKKANEYAPRSVPSFSGAYQVLKRFTKKGYMPFKKKASKEQTAQAVQWLDEIETHAGAQIAKLMESVPKRLGLDGGPWLGHLVSLREDFRGVKPVETYLKKIGYDKTLKRQEKEANKLTAAWHDKEASVPTRFEAVLTHLEDAFLYEGFPYDMREKMREWKGDAGAHVIPTKVLDQYAVFEKWEKGWSSGLKTYRKVWGSWKGAGRN